MYIKQIIIQGFKSYKDQTEVEPFSPGTNVIVGRNGSGKSNFFAAIRFVLSDAYSMMGREERQALLHEGHGSAVMTAYVEIIFDNSDDRFPTGKDELILRRTIGLKKDEYSLDRKNATKTDVMNLLESAGFSRSNPYYIVPQGRVTALTNMKDPERLNLLKEVAGTQVYEARRTESLKIMTETNNKRAKIDESLEYIQERLAELEEEKEELRGYQEKDRDRRCLEYALFHREQTTYAAALDEIEAHRLEGIENTDGRHEEFREGEKAVSKLELQIKQLERQIEELKRERKDLEDDKRQNSRTQAGVEMKLKNLEDGQSSSESARNQHQKKLKDVKDSINNTEKALAKLIPEYGKRKAKENEVRQNLDSAEATRTRLYDKQGRTQQFKTKAERDAWLKKEIQDLNMALGEQKANRINADEEVKSVQSEIKKLEGEINTIRERFDGWEGTRSALQDEVTTAKADLEKIRDDQKALRREEAKIKVVKEEVGQERDRAERELSQSMDRATSQGLAAVRRLKAERNITGAYGTLAELFEVSEGYRIAAEQTAGNSLFHYVVDNEKTASMLVEELQKRKAGRITFVPLAQLRTRNAKLPNASDAIPLINKLKFDKKFDKAINQVFGKTIVCPSLSVAAQYARSHGCNAITTEGDTANKKGAMTGGYHDPRKSRLEAVRNVNKWRDEYEAAKERSNEIEKQLEEKTREITDAMSQERNLERKKEDLEDSFEPLRKGLRVKTEQLGKLRTQLETTERRREAVDKLLKEHGDSLTAHETELVADFKKSLSANEERQLEQLVTTVQELHQQWNELSNSRREVENSKQTLEAELQTLRQRLDQLNGQEIDAAVSNSSGSIKATKKELQKIQTFAAAIEEKLQETEAQIEEAETNVVTLRKEYAGLIEHMEQMSASIEKEARKMEKYASKKALLTAQVSESAKNIRDLGVLPDEAFEKYENTDYKTIDKKLKKVNDALKGFKNVNKKAFEQYNSFTTQRDGLIKRRKELDDSQSSIQELVEVLDQRKDEAIERTFKQVSKEFAQIFEKLVPAGRGRLVIQRKTDKRLREEEDSDEEPRESIENYTGVGISVSFNSKHDDQQRIQQLSGGQKSLCALALVFAIQQCDPAPFYLFDEIDANLDAQYRTAVAQMLETISNQQGDAEGGGMSGQFICTTFRPEMLLVADKCYGVTFHNKTSGIDAVSREEALKFVEGEGPR